MKFQDPDDANMDPDTEASSRRFNTVSVIPAKRKYGATYVDDISEPKKRNKLTHERSLQIRLDKKTQKNKRRRSFEKVEDSVVSKSNPHKRQFALPEAVRNGLLIRDRIVIPPKAGPWLLDGQTGVGIGQLTDMVGGLNIEKTWPQFSRLPPEVRRLIWQHTWEHRVVTISRSLGALQNCSISVPPGQEDHRQKLIRHGKTRLMRAKFWGVRDPYHLQGPHAMQLQHVQFVTSTTTDSKPPVSLFVNYESRQETLLHFQTAFAADRSKPKIYFNFSLDSLKLPRHHPLGLCFEIKDLRKLTSITVPELFPNLPCFYRITGPWDFHRDATVKDARIPRVADGTFAYYPELDRAWQLLRWRFPNLREICLEHFRACKLHDPTLFQNRPGPLVNPTGQEPERSIDQHCNSCRNLQVGVDRRFPRIGVNTPYMERVFESSSIFGSPVYIRAKVVIGTVKAEKKGQKDEDVTVTFWRIRRRPEENPYHIVPMITQRSAARACPMQRIPRGKAKPVRNGPPLWELQIIARSLERFLGPPAAYDNLALDI